MTEREYTRTSLLSKKQLSLFWRLFAKAWQAHCNVLATHGAIPESKDDFRHALILKATLGKYASIKEVANPCFESLMLDMAAITGDEREIGYWTACVERRYRFLIEQALTMMQEMDCSVEYDWEYVRHIYRHSKILPLTLDEVPADHLRAVFQMVDTHRRRLKRRLRDAMEEAPF